MTGQVLGLSILRSLNVLTGRQKPPVTTAAKRHMRLVCSLPGTSYLCQPLILFLLYKKDATGSVNQYFGVNILGSNLGTACWIYSPSIQLRILPLMIFIQCSPGAGNIMHLNAQYVNVLSIKKTRKVEVL